MKGILSSAALVAILSVACCQLAGAQAAHTLRDLTVTAYRPLRDIGVQKTAIDSAALKENIALSMADVLTFNSSVFVKSYGRATLSTVAFRGTSPSHTQVTWNGMRINNPMLGMTDFSTIPGYFIDSASLLHGSSSVNDTGGGIGGLVKLGTLPEAAPGWHLQYVQGIGSFRTFDEFLRVSYGSERWHSTTRAVYSSSPNDFMYTNHDKKVNIYDDDKNIIGQYYPRERNRSGSFKDLHILQELYYTVGAERFGLNAWYINSNRELPLLTTDYGGDYEFDNRQREQTLRTILSWRHSGGSWTSDVRGGWIHTEMAYDYSRDVGGGGGMQQMTRSRSRINTFYGQGEGSWSPHRLWLFTANLSAHQHFVRSHDRNIITQEGDKAVVGYDKGRIELSGSLSARWQATPKLGLSAVMRQEMFGTRFSPVIPAFFVDYVVSRPGNVAVKASVSRNYRFPTLNDMYFLPGGNPDLRSERGISYDAGASFGIGRDDVYALTGSLTWFDSYIDDWILWLPTPKGFFSPRNVKKVHAYGLEAKGELSVQPALGWVLDLNGSLSWTPSVNRGEPMSDADKSVGKQLPYVPRWSASVTGRLSWRTWSFLYKWAYYSERYTMSSNEATITGRLPKYFMSNVSLGYGLPTSFADFDFKLAVNNLFNEDYVTVLSRPMPGINFEFFIGITPKFGKKQQKTSSEI